MLGSAQGVYRKTKVCLGVPKAFTENKLCLGVPKAFTENKVCLGVPKAFITEKIKLLTCFQWSREMVTVEAWNKPGCGRMYDLYALLVQRPSF